MHKTTPTPQDRFPGPRTHPLVVRGVRVEQIVQLAVLRHHCSLVDAVLACQGDGGRGLALSWAMQGSEQRLQNTGDSGT